jgi:hypothetical protein
VSRVDGKRSCLRARGHGLAAFVGTLAIAVAGIHCRGVAGQVHASTANEPRAPQPKSAPLLATASAEAKAAPVDSSLPPPPGAMSPAPSASGSTAEHVASEPAPRLELPRGGREIFPAHRLVGFCGTPGAPALGRLAGNLPQKTKTLLSYAEKYVQGSSRKVLPVFELIAVVVQGAPGNDGKWRRRVPDSVVDEYLQAARAAKALLLLNIQPGHSDFLTEAKHFERYLHLPDVGLALDPEWAMKGKQKPGVTFGQTTGAVLNDVAEYLSGIVKAGDLPEKVLVYHQVNGHVVKDESVLVGHAGVAIIQSVDGLGPKGSKIKTYNFLVKTKPAAVHAGFKLFFDEDKTNGGKLMNPDEVLALSPEPEYVMYE